MILLARARYARPLLRAIPRTLPAIRNLNKMSMSTSASTPKPDPAKDRENVLSTLDQWVEQSKKRLTLPSPPPPSKGWPTPWITKELAEEYFEPLAYRGWGVEFVTDGSKRSAHLKRTIQFKNYDLAIAFMSDLGRVSKAENHHASIVSIIPVGPKAHVSLSVQTHSALPPDWVPIPPSTSTGEANAKRKRTWAGITPRDIRFAVLLEQVLEQNTGVDSAEVEKEREGLDWDAFVKKCKASLG